jgi:hypothetical protein
MFAVKVKTYTVPYNRPLMTRWGVEVQLYSFLISAVDGNGWLTPRPGRFNSGNDQLLIVKDAE